MIPQGGDYRAVQGRKEIRHHHNMLTIGETDRGPDIMSDRLQGRVTPVTEGVLRAHLPSPKGHTSCVMPRGVTNCCLTGVHCSDFQSASTSLPDRSPGL
jgi:hypothetical protein